VERRTLIEIINLVSSVGSATVAPEAAQGKLLLWPQRFHLSLILSLVSIYSFGLSIFLLSFFSSPTSNLLSVVCPLSILFLSFFLSPFFTFFTFFVLYLSSYFFLSFTIL